MDQDQEFTSETTITHQDLVEILLEVNLNFQVWLTIMLACGTFFPEETAWEVQC